MFINQPIKERGYSLCKITICAYVHSITAFTMIMYKQTVLSAGDMVLLRAYHDTRRGISGCPTLARVRFTLYLKHTCFILYQFTQI